MKKTLLDYYTGHTSNIYEGYASDKATASNAASGGFVTAFLSFLLETGKIDGALVFRLECGSPFPKVVPLIAKNRAELMSAQGSIYFSFQAFSPETRNMIASFDGRLAAVALPCGVNALKKLMERDKILSGKIKIVIGLFCGHTSRPELLEKVLAKKHIEPSALCSFRFRKGLWRGNAEAVLKDGSTISWPTAYYNLYQNLFAASAPQCMSCFDHFAEQADVSCGDIWMLKHKNDNVKHSIFASRNEKTDALIAEAVGSGYLTAEPSDQKTLFSANRRAAVFHKAIAARSIALARRGIHINVPPQARAPRWNERLAAKITAYFMTADLDSILKTDRHILKLWLYIFKGLTNF